jgi:hypothetical protein
MAAKSSKVLRVGFAVVVISIGLVVIGCNVLAFSAGGDGGPPGAATEPDDGETLTLPGSSDGGEAVGADDDIPPLAFICPDTEDSFNLLVEQDIRWRPPRGYWLDLKGFGNYQLNYKPVDIEGSKEKNGEFFIINTPPTEVRITLTWPDCVPEPTMFKTSYTPVATGACQAGKVNLQVSERWQSAMLDVFCPPGTKIGGDDGASLPLPLPFALGGEALVDLSYQWTGKDFHPAEIEKPFVGEGGSGSKTYTLIP